MKYDIYIIVLCLVVFIIVLLIYPIMVINTIRANVKDVRKEISLIIELKPLFEQESFLLQRQYKNIEEYFDLINTHRHLYSTGEPVDKEFNKL